MNPQRHLTLPLASLNYPQEMEVDLMLTNHIIPRQAGQAMFAMTELKQPDDEDLKSQLEVKKKTKRTMIMKHHRIEFIKMDNSLKV
jgi:hypothetical protein